MNVPMFLRRAGGVAVLAAWCVAPPAGAVTLQVVPTTPSQVGATAQIQFGHTVVAYTNYNRLTAGGSYRISCNNPSVQPLSGQRTLSSAQILGGISLYVTVPETQPTTRSLPGFTSVPKGTELACTYEWTARAIEGQYTISIGGVGETVGGEERIDGSTILFHMYREDNDGRGCIQF